MHWLDRLSLRWLERERIFEQGWGVIEPFAPRADELHRPHGAPTLALTWGAPHRVSGLTVVDGTAPSPCEGLPAEARTLHVRRVLTPRPARRRVVVPPSWGDGGYGPRQWLVGALVARGLEPWLLEGAWLGARKAPMTRVEDFFRMGLSHIEEIRALLQTHHDEGVPTALAGYSMAGQLGAQAVQSLPFEVPVVVMAASPSADVVFCDGPLSRQVQWAALGEDAKARLADAMRHVSVLAAPPPRSERRAVVVTARDGIVSPAATERIAAHWGVEPIHLATGHLGAYVFERRRLQRIIADTLL
ncbi:MAG: alpha/beta hydrolase family protein [Myxococcota bacterium]